MQSEKKIIIATRKSQLAMWQASFVKLQIESQYPDLKCELLPLSTKGDNIQNTPLSKIGGKGLFAKEIQNALLEGKADIAVHSMKDLPKENPHELTITAVLERASPYDAMVSNKYESFDSLPINAVVGTSSARRSAQILLNRPDIQIKPLRGNVNTRLSKLDDNHYDAIILASAGLERIGLKKRITQILYPPLMIPAAAQGVIGVETCKSNTKLNQLIRSLNNLNTEITTDAEKTFYNTLEGSCQTAIAAFATIDKEKLFLKGLISTANGDQVLMSYDVGSIKHPKSLGTSLAKKILSSNSTIIMSQSIIK